MTQKNQINKFENNPDILPDELTIMAALRRTLPAFSQIEWLSETGSTNADLILRARHNHHQLARPWLLGTHLQSHGRGRAGRTWQNKVGANLMFSCAFDVFVPAKSLATLTSYIGILSCQAMHKLISPQYHDRVKLKWPNDILWDGAKLAGILLESTRSGTSRSADHHLVIIGIGINLQGAAGLSNDLNRSIADWSQVLAADHNCARFNAIDLVSAIASAWYTGLSHVSAYGFTDLPKNYANYDALLNKPVNIIDNGKIIGTGTACGIDNQGHLLVNDGNRTHVISVGEISIRSVP